MAQRETRELDRLPWRRKRKVYETMARARRTTQLPDILCSCRLMPSFKGCL